MSWIFRPMNAETPFVRFRGVRKVYDQTGPAAVSGLDLDVARGEFLTLLGPSGSGKTTTLMMLAGFEAPSAGAIELDGVDISRLAPHRRGLGMVFQNYALFPHMTVAENLAFPLKVRRLRRAEIARKVTRALEMVRLDGLADRRPAQLSGGQQQRVAVARALVFEPRAVLMDEPLGALDKALREQLQYEIRRIHRELGVTMIYVTHDQSEALTLSDRIAVFNRGRVEQCAAPGALYDRPDNLFVAGFVGENNFLNVDISGSQDETVRADHAAGSITARGVDIRAGRAVVAIRPERIALNAAPGPDRTTLRAVVEEVYFAGDHARVVARLSPTETFAVKTPRTAMETLPQPGEQLSISWKTADALAFAPADDAIRAREPEPA